MTQNIVDMLKEQAMQGTLPTPTEKAQIVLMYTSGANTIFRFNSVKKGEKEYGALKKAWDYHKAKAGPSLHDVAGDMFVGAIDLSQLVNINFVDHAKRAKFIPVQ